MQYTFGAYRNETVEIGDVKMREYKFCDKTRKKVLKM